MTVLAQSELQASSLADLHAIADQLGLDGFRRLRKAELIDAILAASGASKQSSTTEQDASPTESGPRKRRSSRLRRGKPQTQNDQAAAENEPETASGKGRESQPKSERSASKPAEQERIVEGVVELLGNGSAFLRIDPPEPSDDDVYISAAQVRRCGLVSGDRVSGPVRKPRRTERYPSLIRVEEINGSSADSIAEGPRYEDLPVAYPNQRLEMDPQDPTLKAIEWLTPIGLGSRALIVGPSGAGKTETLRRILGALSAKDGLEITLVLVGVRPEEVTASQEGSITPSATLNFAASADSQSHALEHAIEAAKRVATRGAHAVVLIDTLDGVNPHSARKILASARNLADGGSVTVIATATRPFGGESTVIALDVARTSTGRFPALDLLASATLKPELLVGDDGASAIIQARAAAAEH